MITIYKKGCRLPALVFVLCSVVVVLFYVYIVGEQKPGENKISAARDLHTVTVAAEPLSSEDYLIPPDLDLFKMEENTLMQIYWKYINMLQTLCKDVIRVGSLKDGGKEICIDKPYKPSAPCLVYSFGINYLWDFDKAIVDMFGCDVHCFDPSMDNNTQQISEHIWFYKWGLGGITSQRQTMEYQNLGHYNERLGHTNRSVDILKIDIEGDEWKTIPQMITSGALENVKQISMETHFSRVYAFNTKYWGNTKPAVHLSALRQLYDYGFRTFMRERNLWSHQSWPGFNGYITNVNEVSLIKVQNAR